MNSTNVIPLRLTKANISVFRRSKSVANHGRGAWNTAAEKMRLIQSVTIFLLLQTLARLSCLAHKTQRRGSRWSAVRGKRSLHAPSTVDEAHVSVSRAQSTGRQLCKNMDRLEELHGRWKASNTPARKVRCML